MRRSALRSPQRAVDAQGAAPGSNGGRRRRGPRSPMDRREPSERDLRESGRAALARLYRHANAFQLDADANPRHRAQHRDCGFRCGGGGAGAGSGQCGPHARAPERNHSGRDHVRLTVWLIALFVLRPISTYYPMLVAVVRCMEELRARVASAELTDRARFVELHFRRHFSAACHRGFVGVLRYSVGVGFTVSAVYRDAELAAAP